MDTTEGTGQGPEVRDEEPGFRNIDKLPLGKLLKIKQSGRQIGKHTKKSLKTKKMRLKGFDSITRG